MKKLVSLFLALCLVLACCAVAFATEAPNYDGTVTVSGIAEGNTLKLYKVVTATVGDDNAIHYTPLTGLPTKYDEISEISAIESDSTAANAMANAYGNFFSGKNPDYTATAGEDGTATVTVAPGLYFAIVSGNKDSSVVYKSMLINAVPEVEGNGYKGKVQSIVAKKESTTIQKTEYDPASEKYAKTTDGYSRGDSIPFKIETSFPNYPSDSKYATFVISDTPTGLKDTISTIEVYVDGTKVAQDDAKFKVAEVGNGFTVTFEKEYILANPGKSVKVEYKAVLTAPAVGSGDTSNTATITYNPNPFEDTTVQPPDHDDQKTYGLVFEKVDDKQQPLANAVFSLYYDKDLTKPVKDLEGKALTFTTEVVNGHAYVWWDGLAAGTYWIHEDSAPAGYVTCADFSMTCSKEKSTKDNPATSTVEDNYTDDSIKAVNNPGAQLPSTGGIGTTIFYVLGGLLVVGAAIILVARRKADEK